MNRKLPNTILLIACAVLLGSCVGIEPEPFTPSSGHILAPEMATATAPETAGEIPELVEQIPLLPEPQTPKEQEKYTVVVNEVPVKELLFALARDANVNVDIAPTITGVVTINAVEQTLYQLLDRISRQVALRYEFQEQNLLVLPDAPFFRTYHIDYIDMSRSTESTIEIANQIESATGGGGASGGGGGGGGAGSGTSSIEINSAATNAFWSNLILNIIAIIGAEGGADSSSDGDELPITENVIAHPETGLLTVKATSKQHELVQQIVTGALVSANRQVMIQATIIEVTLNDRYQAGIEWNYLAAVGKAGFNVESNSVTSSPVGTTSLFKFSFNDPNPDRDRIGFAVSLLEEFGDVSVLSSPQIMALNNQTALLQVVDNVVFFDVKQETITPTQGPLTSTFETTPRTVPVGITMSITPQINDNESVILNVRPSISRITRFVTDPNPALTISNLVPEIQVRQMESMLRLNNNQIGVLGGLMQDNTNKATNAIPGLANIPGLGLLFQDRQRRYSKTELVIFLRPIIVNNPGIDGDLKSYKRFLVNHPGIDADGKPNKKFLSNHPDIDADMKSYKKFLSNNPGIDVDLQSYKRFLKSSRN